MVSETHPLQQKSVANTAGKRAKPYRVVVHGLGYFCQKLPALMNSERWKIFDRSGHSLPQIVELVRDLAFCDLAYSWGGRISMGKFLWLARLLGKRKIILLWSGSDVLFAQQEMKEGRRDAWVCKLQHWAVSPWIAEEVRAMGLDCQHVEVSMIPRVEHPKPLPAKFSVLIFVRHVDRAELYGWDRMVEVARRLPHVDFNLCGLPDGQMLTGPPNIKVHNWMSDLTPLLEQTTVVYRPVRHDGLSFTVLESLAHGRYVLYSYPLPGCTQVTTVETACAELQRLLNAHQSGSLSPNVAGMNYIAAQNAPEVVCPEMLRRWEEIIVS